MENLRDEIYEMIASTLEVRKEDIDPSSRWEDRDVDSFALVELLVGLQERFHVRFDPNELRGMKTVQDMVSLVERKKSKPA